MSKLVLKAAGIRIAKAHESYLVESVDPSGQLKTNDIFVSVGEIQLPFDNPGSGALLEVELETTDGSRVTCEVFRQGPGVLKLTRGAKKRLALGNNNDVGSNDGDDGDENEDDDSVEGSNPSNGDDDDDDDDDDRDNKGGSRAAGESTNRGQDESSDDESVVVLPPPVLVQPDAISVASTEPDDDVPSVPGPPEPAVKKEAVDLKVSRTEGADDKENNVSLATSNHPVKEEKDKGQLVDIGSKKPPVMKIEVGGNEGGAGFGLARNDSSAKAGPSSGLVFATTKDLVKEKSLVDTTEDAKREEIVKKDKGQLVDLGSKKQPPVAMIEVGGSKGGADLSLARNDSSAKAGSSSGVALATKQDLISNLGSKKPGITKEGLGFDASNIDLKTKGGNTDLTIAAAVSITSDDGNRSPGDKSSPKPKSMLAGLMKGANMIGGAIEEGFAEFGSAAEEEVANALKFWRGA